MLGLLSCKATVIESTISSFVMFCPFFFSLVRNFNAGIAFFEDINNNLRKLKNLYITVMCFYILL